MTSATKFHKAHFIGIGGAGMSGIALVLHERGCEVSGSDLKESRYVRDVQQAGIPVTLGHTAKTIDAVKPDVVVISTAIPESNPELMRARELNIPVLKRAQMLSELAQGRRTIAVAGTHGKTTTSSMIASMLIHLNSDPSFLIGGVVEEFATNGRNGSGELYVAEADESDASFLFLSPSICVVTNIEADHLDHYGSLEAIEETFARFIASCDTEGTVIVCADDERASAIAQKNHKHCITYGFHSDADYVVYPEPEKTQGIASYAQVRTPQNEMVEVRLATNPGLHNQLNAAAALVVATELGFDVDDAAQALSQFRGVGRRFTHKGDVEGITVVDDYGHHPTEIAATLKAAATLGYKRVVCVFQPHRYSRTQALAQEFGHAFKDANVLCVLDVFSAGETPIPGISGNTIVQEVEKTGEVEELYYLPTRTTLAESLKGIVAPGDLVITMGAGDVTMVGPELLDVLAKK